MVKQDWIPPSNPDARRTGLVVNNSMTRNKDPFVPQEGNRVGMYICGPTVYDSAHIGHARCYVTFDIIRRILESYFNYNVEYVMNVTDIDDKIILRARRGYLLEEYAKETAGDAARVSGDVLERALPKYEAKAAALEEADPKREMMSKAAEKMREAVSGGAPTASALREACADALAEWLDAERGATVTDHSIFASLPRRYELEFFEDLRALGVRLPDAVTRVSEYVPEVVAYVQKIMDNGHAYASNGSVYFDTRHFAESHQYAKLAPEHVNDDAMRAEGEGALAAGSDKSEKRCPNDFALWKRSKDGEPAWDSPWGPGRPGWHIECSAMACDRLPGAPFDIHAGGVDLKFPHHDNEIAQAEAYYDCAQWVNYFLHAGHVHIEGLKMSKSLKNFVTIGAARAHFTPRQLRMFFLSYAWDSPMDYSLDGMQNAIDRESRFHEFFHAVREFVRESKEEEETSAADGGHLQHWSEREVELNESLQRCKSSVHAALCNNFDYPRVMLELQNLVTACNRYLGDRKTRRRGHVVRQAAQYVTHIFRVVGLVSDGTDKGAEFGWGESAGDASAGGASVEETVMPHLRALGDFRKQVRDICRSSSTSTTTATSSSSSSSSAAAAADGSGDLAKTLLKLCDQLRDDVLPILGVRLEDRGDGSYAVKLEDPEVMRREKERAEEERREKLERKERAKAEAEAKRLEKEKIKERAQVEPNALFQPANDPRGWSAFDEEGVPTKDKDGNDVSPEERETLLAERKAHERLRKKILKIKK